MSERMLMKKMWDYMIKDSYQGNKYLLFEEERGEMHKFVKEQLRKEIIVKHILHKAQ